MPKSIKLQLSEEERRLIKEDGPINCLEALLNSCNEHGYYVSKDNLYHCYPIKYEYYSCGTEEKNGKRRNEYWICMY